MVYCAMVNCLVVNCPVMNCPVVNCLVVNCPKVKCLRSSAPSIGFFPPSVPEDVSAAWSALLLHSTGTWRNCIHTCAGYHADEAMQVSNPVLSLFLVLSGQVWCLMSWEFQSCGRRPIYTPSVPENVTEFVTGKVGGCALLFAESRTDGISFQ